MSFPRVMATGHQPQNIPQQSHQWVKSELERIAVKLRDQNGMQVGISGMGLGADTWWGFATLFAWCDLWAFVPYLKQPKGWQSADVARWDELRSRAKHEAIFGNEHSEESLRTCGDGMVQNADLVIAVLNPAQTTGGTASCVQKAAAAGKPIIHVNPITQSTMMLTPGRTPS